VEVDLLIKNAKIYNSYFKKFLPGVMVVKGKKIYYIGETIPDQLQINEIIDLQGKRIVPGLIDIHLHIESSMAAPKQFADELIKHGITTIVSEPHEIANTSGIAGIKAMLKAGQDAVVDIFYGIPSSVPSTSPNFETTGGKIALPELQELLNEEKVICLGEVMNNRAVVNDEQDAEINNLLAYLDQNRPNYIREGHIPSLLGVDLAHFVYRGIDSDHTLQTVERLKERILNGVFVEIQEKSMLPEIINYIKDNNLFERIAFVTDDVMADTLVEEGHLDKLIRKAVQMGITLEDAIYMAAYTPAQRMRLYDRGSLAPGKRADFIILAEKEIFLPERVYAAGKEVYRFANSKQESKYKRAFPESFYRSIQLKPLTEKDLSVKVRNGKESARCRVMMVQNDTTYTEVDLVELGVSDDSLNWEKSSCNLAAVFARYGTTSSAKGLISGSTIKKGAVATTYAHDHHNLYLIAENRKDGLIAANWVIEHQGGYCVVRDGKIIAAVELPVAGILSEKPMPELAAQIAKIRAALIELGYDHYNPIMSLSTNTLPVSPALKITDKGLIAVNEMEIVDLVVE